VVDDGPSEIKDLSRLGAGCRCRILRVDRNHDGLQWDLVVV